VLKKILISIKLILINLGNGFIHQTVLVVSPRAWEDKYLFCPRFCKKKNINDFRSAKSKYFL